MNLNLRLLALALFTYPALLPAQVTDALNSVAWTQTSVEFRGNALQAWRSARLSLPRALKDKKWTAAVEQTGNFRKLPPAIIVDIDETVLDNSPGQARFLLDGNGRYTMDAWMKWTSERKAKAIPGAAEFLREAASRGVTVFYVTNRGPKEEANSRANLEAEGFPLKAAALGDIGDTVMMAGEKPEWTSDKGIRRALIAKYYRIILLCGDDLNDFIPARLTVAERATKAKPYESWWGERWIILPNSSYGSWEDTLYGFDRSLAPQAIQERKLKSLRRD
ncbi:HAD family acid phosphatase [uncultured Paludibaculum sp.]|uniref:5'-nucleotidase, lipoprotein e(P4) family n=1 Tax=uncultured Paludibaculum sp. TaxID=1765020 RepID=UPI002AAAF1BC|nr:HAD family acid phosphatase [uncultured Paludibaculum sp.]